MRAYIVRFLLALFVLAVIAIGVNISGRKLVDKKYSQRNGVVARINEDLETYIRNTDTSLINEEAMIESVLLGANIKDVKAKIVKGKMDDHNTFDAPDVVKEEEFKNISFKNDKIRYTIPPSSVMCIEVTA